MSFCVRFHPPVAGLEPKAGNTVEVSHGSGRSRLAWAVTAPCLGGSGRKLELGV